MEAIRDRQTEEEMEIHLLKKKGRDLTEICLLAALSDTYKDHNVKRRILIKVAQQVIRKIMVSYSVLLLFQSLPWPDSLLISDQNLSDAP